MSNQIYQHQYMHLDVPVKEKLRKIFNIPKTGVAEILNETVISDGIRNEDLAVLTEEAMSAYLGNVPHETFGHLFDLVVEKIKYEIENPQPIVIVEEVPSIVDEAIKLSSETKEYCGACVTHKGRHRLNCPTGIVVKLENEKNK